MENKTLELTGGTVEFVRSADGKTRISGYAVEYSDKTPATEYRVGKFRETVTPGAFREIIRSGQPIPIVWNHNKDMELGRSDYPDVTVREDSKGVYVEVDFDETDPTHQLVRSKQNKPGSRLGWSFHGEGKATEDKVSGEYVRSIDRIVKLWDLSVVMRPANGGTKVFIRSEDDVEAIEKLESKLQIIEDAKNVMGKTR